MQLNIEHSDGSTTSLSTDETWKISGGPVVYNDIFGGETYDARLEQPGWAETGFDDQHWDNALIKEEPGGSMVSQVMERLDKFLADGVTLKHVLGYLFTSLPFQAPPKPLL